MNVVVDINAYAAQETAHALVAADGTATACTADVSNPDACEAMVAQAIAGF